MKLKKIITAIMTGILLIPFALAESEIFSSNLRLNAKSIYYGTLSFLSSNFTQIFLLLSAILFALILFALVGLFIAMMKRLGRAGSG